MEKIFLVRHAIYNQDFDGDNPDLSNYGREQALRLAFILKENLGADVSKTVIWSSPAKRAQQTAEIIQQKLGLSEVVLHEKLWSAKGHPQDFPWLKEELIREELKGVKKENLIIISHLEYVNDFPVSLGFLGNRAGYAKGVLIHNDQCSVFG